MDGVMSNVAAAWLGAPSRWELAAEAIAVKIRWFGVLLGYVVVNIATHPPERLVTHVDQLADEPEATIVFDFADHRRG